MDSQDNDQRPAAAVADSAPADEEHTKAEAASESGWRPVVLVAIAALVCAAAAGVFFAQWDSTRNVTAARAAAAAEAPPVVVALPTGKVSAAAVDVVGSDYGDEANRAFLDAAATEQVALAARSILTTIYSYDYTDIASHADRIKPLMTADVFAQYQRAQPPNIEIVEQARTTVRAAIADSAMGVVSLTGDTAVVETVLAIQGDNGGAPVLDGQQPMRVTLQKVDGQWIVSEMLPV